MVLSWLITFSGYVILLYLLEVVSHYRDSQLHVGENYSHLFNLGPTISKSCCLKTRVIPNNSDLKTNLKTTKVLISSERLA